MQRLKSIPMKEELVKLVRKYGGDGQDALLLQQAIYWTDIVDKMDAEIWDRVEAMRKVGSPEEDIEEQLAKLRNGWYYKTLDGKNGWYGDMMETMSKPTLSRRLKWLAKWGFIEIRNDPNKKMSRGRWYTANIYTINEELKKIGYTLQGYAMSSKGQRPAKKESVDKSVDNPVDKPVDKNKEEPVDNPPKDEFSLYNWVSKG